MFNSDDKKENQQPRPPPLPHTHLPCLVIVFDLTQISTAGLSDPLPRHEVPHHDGRRADLWTGGGGGLDLPGLFLPGQLAGLWAHLAASVAVWAGW